MDTIDIDHAGGTGQIKLITTKTHQDHVYVYHGQNYGCCESSALHALNELSRRNFLQLHQRQITNRDVRILLPQHNHYCNNNQYQRRSNLKFNLDVNGGNLLNDENYNLDENYLDDDRGGGCGSSRGSLPSLRHIENKNYQIFLSNFNKIATACYLKLLKASKNLWDDYGIEDQLAEGTNFFVLNKPSESSRSKLTNERAIQKNLADENFIRQYVDLIVQVHSQIVNKLHQLLNFQPLRVHFNSANNGSSKLKNQSSAKKGPGSDCHLFRSFRILGLRQDKRRSQCYKTTNSNQVHFCNYNNNHDHKSCNNTTTSSMSSTSSSNVKIINNPFKSQSNHHDNINSFDPSKNFIIKNNFNEIIDIRGAFDIKQFQNKMGYDVFIECEMNYYNVLSDRIFSNNKNVHQTSNFSHCNYHSENINISTASSSSLSRKPPQPPPPSNQHNQFLKQNKSEYKYFKRLFKTLNGNEELLPDDDVNHSQNRHSNCRLRNTSKQKHNDINSETYINANKFSNMRYGDEPPSTTATNIRYSRNLNDPNSNSNDFNYRYNYNNNNNGSYINDDDNNLNEMKFLNKNLMNQNNFAYKYTDEDLKNVLTNINRNYKINLNKNINNSNNQYQSETNYHNNSNNNNNNANYHSFRVKSNFCVN